MCKHARQWVAKMSSGKCHTCQHMVQQRGTKQGMHTASIHDNRNIERAKSVCKACSGNKCLESVSNDNTLVSCCKRIHPNVYVCMKNVLAVWQERMAVGALEVQLPVAMHAAQAAEDAHDDVAVCVWVSWAVQRVAL